MKRIALLLVLAFVCGSYAMTGFTYFWTPKTKDTVTSVRLKANYDTTRLWAGRIADTMNKKAKKNQDSLFSPTIGGVLTVDSINSIRNIKAIGFNGPLIGNVTGNVTGSSGSCSGNAATATTALACSGNAATATTASACSGNAATATTASDCSGNAATATTAVNLSGGNVLGDSLNIHGTVIQKNGNVGIGTTAPTKKLTINGDLTDTGNGLFTGTVTATGGFVGNVTGNTSGSSGSCTGNAATATTATLSDSAKGAHHLSGGYCGPDTFNCHGIVGQKNGYFGVGTTTPAYVLEAKNTVATNGLAATLLGISRGIAYNTAVAGDGVGMVFKSSDRDANLWDIAYINARWVSPVSGSRSSQLEFNTVNEASGLAPKVRMILKNNGDLIDSGNGLFTGTVTATGGFVGNTSGSSGSCTGNAATATTATNVNGGIVKASAGDTGSFVYGLTGMTTTVTGTARYQKMGKQITIWFGAANGNSNSTSMSITGIPSLLLTTSSACYHFTWVLNNSSLSYGAICISNVSTWDVGFNGPAGAFGSSGTKGITTSAITYLLE